jgi:hypothetical protein
MADNGWAVGRVVAEPAFTVSIASHGRLKRFSTLLMAFALFVGKTAR